MNADSMLMELKGLSGAPGQRLYQELAYARRVSLLALGKYDGLLCGAAQRALDAQRAQGCLTLPMVWEIEKELLVMQPECKKYLWLLIGHAHIDMNWMWRYDETAAVTLDTFRTMLTLMEEYPRFTFAQSQASTYEIVEKYDPHMLAEIRARVREGRWEVTASSWVEPDRNMPSLESEIRHLLYTKKYLSQLLSIPAESLNLDFEPDTFGHNANMPTVLSQAGVKYLYHCRGERNRSLYRWQGNGGGEVLVFSDPAWYNMSITGELAAKVPDFCRENHVRAALTVYGVGDHGGGPTRRDLNRILEMMDWPLFPTIKFGTYQEFFALCEEERERLPVLTGERNCVFTGCYTSQSRIKKANAMAERMLGAGEMFSAFAHVHAGGAYRANAFEGAWRRVLFNHFHDILPGSCVRDTREYAMGQYQEAFAVAMAARRSAYARLGQAMDTSRFSPDDRAEDMAMGAGIGFAMWEGQISPYCRMAGSTRIFHLFNPLPFQREELAELTVWDYLDDVGLLQFTDENDRPLPHQIVGDGTAMDWSHHFTRVLVPAKVPACGYATIVLRKNAAAQPAPPVRQELGSRFQAPFSMILENDRIAVRFDPVTARIVCFTDKETGEEKLTDGGFDFILEDPSAGMTAWTVGRYMRVNPAGDRVRVRKTLHGPLRSAYEVTAPFGAGSVLQYTVSIDQGDTKLVYTMNCDWHELGGAEGIPQLSFSVRLPRLTDAFHYRIPGGQLQRKAEAQDKPSLGAMAAGGVGLLCDSRYGFRGEGERMRVSIIRGSFDPDPIPESGRVACRIGVGLCGENELYEKAEAFAQYMDVTTNTCHAGALPLSHSFLRQEGDPLELSGLKLCEDGRGLAVHLCNPGGQTAHTRLLFYGELASAAIIDYLERPVSGCAAAGNTVELTLPARAMTALKIVMK